MSSFGFMRLFAADPKYAGFIVRRIFRPAAKQLAHTCAAYVRHRLPACPLGVCGSKQLARSSDAWVVPVPQIPPAPPKRTFHRAKELATLGAGDAEMPQGGLAKLKSEIQRCGALFALTFARGPRSLPLASGHATRSIPVVHDLGTRGLTVCGLHGGGAASTSRRFRRRWRCTRCS